MKARSRQAHPLRWPGNEPRFMNNWRKFLYQSCRKSCTYLRASSHPEADGTTKFWNLSIAITMTGPESAESRSRMPLGSSCRVNRYPGTAGPPSSLDGDLDFSMRLGRILVGSVPLDLVVSSVGVQPCRALYLEKSMGGYCGRASARVSSLTSRR